MKIKITSCTISFLVLVILLSFCSGCYTVDSEAVFLLSRRIESLERQNQSNNKTNIVFTSKEDNTRNFVIIYVPLESDISMDISAYVPVKIVQTGPHDFVGPKGEIYYGVPTVEQLKKIYSVLR